jgi:hypothetical protein
MTNLKTVTEPKDTRVETSDAFLEVLNLCNAAHYIAKQRDDKQDVAVSLSLLRKSAYRIYLKIIDVHEMDKAKDLIYKTKWM